MKLSSSSAGVIVLVVALIALAGGVALSGNGAMTEEMIVSEAAAPNYPALAAAANVSGKVTVEIHTTEKGTVDRVAALEGHALLRAESEAAAKRWKFKSGVGGTLRIHFVFTLLPSKTQPHELLTVFRPPYEIEVRQAMPESIVTSDPKG
jgi:TonB family protein